MQPLPENNFLLAHSQLLIESFYRHTGRQLLPKGSDDGDYSSEHQQLAGSPFAVVSHGTQVQPIFNYANNAALSLFEMQWSEFTSLPSSKSAEKISQTEREHLLNNVNKRGYIDDYQGVRITASGKRFKIEDAVVWNLIDAADNYCGRAAILYRLTYLKKT
ncbi:MAG: hypothetical protein ACJAY7_000382 [Pseudohongiellaceae bacterium]|jgi:hypothetical protein